MEKSALYPLRGIGQTWASLKNGSQSSCSFIIIIIITGISIHTKTTNTEKQLTQRYRLWLSAAKEPSAKKAVCLFTPTLWIIPSMPWHHWLGDRKGMRPVKIFCTVSLWETFSSVLWHCWLGKGHPACKKLGVGPLVVTIWLELCTYYTSSSCHQSPPISSLAPIKSRTATLWYWLTKLHLENGHWETIGDPTEPGVVSGRPVRQKPKVIVES